MLAASLLPEANLDVEVQHREHIIDGKKVEAKAAVPKNSSSGSSLTKKMFVGGTVSTSCPAPGQEIVLLLWNNCCKERYGMSASHPWAFDAGVSRAVTKLLLRFCQPQCCMEVSTLILPGSACRATLMMRHSGSTLSSLETLMIAW